MDYIMDYIEQLFAGAAWLYVCFLILLLFIFLAPLFIWSHMRQLNETANQCHKLLKSLTLSAASAAQNSEAAVSSCGHMMGNVAKLAAASSNSTGKDGALAARVDAVANTLDELLSVLQRPRALAPCPSCGAKLLACDSSAMRCPICGAEIEARVAG